MGPHGTNGRTDQIPMVAVARALAECLGTPKADPGDGQYADRIDSATQEDLKIATQQFVRHLSEQR